MMNKNKNHNLQTRRVKEGHYQVVIVNVQSGKCLKVLADAVKEPEMTPTEFEQYVEGMYQEFSGIERSSDIAAGILRNEWY